MLGLSRASVNLDLSIKVKATRVRPGKLPLHTGSHATCVGARGCDRQHMGICRRSDGQSKDQSEKDKALNSRSSTL
jgi:hypothetical protein